MASITEKIELLGKGLYSDSKIPDKLTLKSIPTASELEYVGAEDFDKVMLEKIFPQAIEEKIDFEKLFEILRALRHGEQERHEQPFVTVFQLEAEAVFRLEAGRVAFVQLETGQAHSGAEIANHLL